MQRIKSVSILINKVALKYNICIITRTFQDLWLEQEMRCPFPFIC